MEIPENIRAEIIKMQQLQQQLQMLMFQKQNAQIQTSEIEGALKEITETAEKEAYEIVGNVMLKKTKEELNKGLTEKKDILGIKMQSLDKQIERIDKQVKEIQTKLNKEFKEAK